MSDENMSRVSQGQPVSSLSGPPEPVWPFSGVPELEATQARLLGAFGHVPSTYRSLAHAPQLMNGWLDMAWLLRREATVDEGVRELAILRKAYLHNVDYIWRHHWEMALKVGVTPGKLAAVHKWRDSAEFTPAERAVLTVVDELVAECRISPEAWRGLRQQFTDQQAVELVVVISFYSCAAQTLAGLQVKLEDSLSDVPPVPPKVGDGDRN